VNPRGLRPGNRLKRPAMEQRVFADQRPVEVARDRLDLTWEIAREVQPWGLLRKSTSACRSAGGSVLYDFGITSW
jgi:hypothetical protein